MNNLERFVKAQENDYYTALNEIRAGHKVSHWMWYIFPQLKGLGKSSMSSYYGIEDGNEALQYYQHPILGQRLIEISKALLQLPEELTSLDIFGSIDSWKLKSCMTLFFQVSNDEVFNNVLMKFYDGRKEQRTMSKLNNDQ